MPHSAIQVGLDATVSRAVDVLGAEVAGEVVLMSVDQGFYFGLAETARAIWERVAEPVRVADLCRDLVLAYEGDAEQITTETLRFLDQMLAKGVLRLL